MENISSGLIKREKHTYRKKKKDKDLVMHIYMEKTNI